MPWLKRNLFLVVGGAVALALLGFAGFFLYAKIQKNREVTEQLDAQTQELMRLATRNPHPGTDQLDNITAAQKEAEKLQLFVGKVKQFFPPTLEESQLPEFERPREFRARLDRTIAELQRGAETSGVDLPVTNYLFTFAPQKSSVTYANNVILPLTAQLLEIKALCEILYNAKVVAIQNLKRSSVATEDQGFTDYMTNKPVTNQYAIASPYEVTFTGFSEELANVLEGIVKSPTCFVVKSLTIEHADSAPGMYDQTTMPYEQSPYPNPYGYNQGLESRYGMGISSRYGGAGGSSRYGMSSRYGGAPGGGMDPSLAQRYGLSTPAVPQPGTARRSASGMLLEEKLLRITLSLDAVKLKPATAQ